MLKGIFNSMLRTKLSFRPIYIHLVWLKSCVTDYDGIYVLLTQQQHNERYSVFTIRVFICLLYGECEIEFIFVHRAEAGKDVGVHQSGP